MPELSASTKIFLTGVSLIVVICMLAGYVHIASRFITWVARLIP